MPYASRSALASSKIERRTAAKQDTHRYVASQLDRVVGQRQRHAQQVLLVVMADPDRHLLANCAVAGEGLGRPSMETGFHALLDGRWVLHLHSLAQVQTANLAAGQPIAQPLLQARPVELLAMSNGAGIMRFMIHDS